MMLDILLLTALFPLVLGTMIYVLFKKVFFWWLEKNGFVRKQEEINRTDWPYAEPKSGSHRRR